MGISIRGLFKQPLIYSDITFSSVVLHVTNYQETAFIIRDLGLATVLCYWLLP